ncbi:MAG: DMT family transporter [Holosporaceae bacterium]|jgi:drug/metabolite transporter (DMT)-like permease|nr:DMT family transporter [Holosporaceae bacterium]
MHFKLGRALFSKEKQGYLWVVFGVCLYSFSDAIMKYFMPLYGVHQVTFLRTVFRFMPFVLVAFHGRINPFRSDRKKENIFRSLLASAGTYFFMCAYGYSPMTDVFVVGLTTAIFVIPLSVWILKEKFCLRNVLAVLLGFGGIWLAFRPGSGIFQLGIMFALMGAIISAINQVIIKRLTSTESELTIIFYHHLSLALISACIGFETFSPISGEHALPLFLGGAIGAAAQYSIIHAFKLSTSSGLASATYFMLVPNTLIDFFLYDKTPDIYIILGLILILMGNLCAFLRNQP